MKGIKEKGRLLLVFLLVIVVSIPFVLYRVAGYALVYRILFHETVLAVMGVLLISFIAICLVKGTKKK